MYCTSIIVTQGRELKALTISSNIANAIPFWKTSKSERALTYIDRGATLSKVKLAFCQVRPLPRQVTKEATWMITCHLVQQILVGWFAHELFFLGEQDYSIPLPEILNPPEPQTDIQRASERQNSDLPRDAIG